MGLFDFIGDVCGSICSAIGNAIDVVEDIFSGTRSSGGDIATEVIKEMPKEVYDPRTATINQTMEMNKFIDETRNKYRKILHEKEEATIKYVRDIFNKILKEIDKKIVKSNDDDKNINININDIDIKFNQSIYDFRNTFANTVLDKISLSNGKCEDILKIEDTSTKRKKMENYLNGLIDDALDNFCKGIDDITKKSTQAIEENINRALLNHKESINNIKKELDENIKLKDDEIAKKRKEYERREKIIKSLMV